MINLTLRNIHANFHRNQTTGCVILADLRKIVSDVGLSSKFPIFGISSPISPDIELKFLL